MDNQDLKQEVRLEECLKVLQGLGITTSIFVSNFKMLLDTKKCFENNIHDEELAQELVQDIKNMEYMLKSVECGLNKALEILN